MLKVNDELYSIDRDTDLVFSEDDNGWYLQLYLHNEAGDTKIGSKVYRTKEAALNDYNNETIVWID